jgi:cbb3-type cytochrome oxidase subunit 3
VKLSDVMSNAGLAGYAEAALVLFVLAFIGIVLAVFRPSQKARMDAASRLPLDDDPTVQPEEDTRS